MSELTLMGRSIPIAAQPWPRVARLGRQIVERLESNSLARLDDESYAILAGLAPDVCLHVALYEWKGFESVEQMQASPDGLGEGDAPTVPEVKAAFQTALVVNLGMPADAFASISKAVTTLKGLVDPTLLSAVATRIMQDLMGEMALRIPSSRSPSQNGMSPSTTGSPPSPHSDQSHVDGPSLASVAP